MSKLPGMILTPCASDKREYRKIWKKSKFFIDKDFLESYREHIIAMEHISAHAKLYIIDNWKKVKDWSGLEITIENHDPHKNKESVVFFNYDIHGFRKYKPHRKDTNTDIDNSLDEFWTSMEKDDRKKHNPITSVTKPILDYVDGDFSITINGISFWWIEDDAVITIADYIEKEIAKENGDKDNREDSI